MRAPRGRRACSLDSLEDRLLAVLEQAMRDDRLDVAEHLLCALEVLAPGCAPGSPLAAAYLLIAGRKDS